MLQVQDGCDLQHDRLLVHRPLPPSVSMGKGCQLCSGTNVSSLQNSGGFKIQVVRGPKAIFGVNLALGSIQCFIVVFIAPESPDSKSTVTLGEIELFMF